MEVNRGQKEFDNPHYSKYHLFCSAEGLEQHEGE